MNLTHCVDCGSRSSLEVMLVSGAVNKDINNSEQNLYEGQIFLPSDYCDALVHSALIALGLS